ncbi:hypothetical protein D6774_00485 [Candidatus Woesearchaeota archaeon]|nr:MAG: hypothetical protein D6774_00485 [Candidatus Woesearchaeota archaeon]
MRAKLTNGLIVAGVLWITLFALPQYAPSKSVPHQQEQLEHLQNSLHATLIPAGKYRCCLEKPCSYCLSDVEGCSCLDDVMNAKAPCVECVGEILKGEGNKFLAPYFAVAIAEKTGELEAMQHIIEEKYGIEVQDQI